MFHLFAGQGYYPESGLGDYIGPYETLDEAEAEGKNKTAPRGNFSWGEQDWYSVITESDGRLVEVASGWGKIA